MCMVMYRLGLAVVLVWTFFSGAVDQNTLNRKEQTVRDLLIPLIDSASVEKAAELINTRPFDEQRALVQSIISEKNSSLKQEDKIRLILAVASSHKNNTTECQKIFDFLKNREVKNGRPVLFVASSVPYQELIPLLMQWADTQSKTLLKGMVHEALLYAVDGGHVREFKNMCASALPIDVALAKEVLWHVVDTNRKSEFVGPLVSKGAPVNGVYNKKWLLLTRAAVNGNVSMAQALIQAGADVNKIADPTIGSPLQIALAKKNFALETVLRKNGARE